MNHPSAKPQPTNASPLPGERRLSAFLLAILLGLLPGRAVLAQYLEPPQGQGYLDEPSPPPMPDVYPAPPEPLLRFGAGLSLGAGYTAFDALDEAFFAPNAAKTFGAFFTLAIQVGAFIQFGPAFRLGVQGGSQLAGSGALYTSFGGVGLSLEGGLPLAPGWSLWGGPVLGYQGLYAESKDPQSLWLEYSADYLSLRLQLSIERQLWDFMSLRGTVFYTFSNLLDEDFATESRSATIPYETDFDQHSGGLLVGLLFGT